MAVNEHVHGSLLSQRKSSSRFVNCAAPCRLATPGASGDSWSSSSQSFGGGSFGGGSMDLLFTPPQPPPPSIVCSQHDQKHNKYNRLVRSRPLIWQQRALTRVERMPPSFPPADFLGTYFPPQEERGKERSVFDTSLLSD